VVVAEADVHHVPDGNGIALRGFNYHRALFNGAYRHYGHLWLIDDGCTHDAAKSTHIGKGMVSNPFRAEHQRVERRVSVAAEGNYHTKRLYAIGPL